MPALESAPRGASYSPSSRTRRYRGHFLICACGTAGCGIARKTAFEQLAAVVALSPDVDDANRLLVTTELTHLADSIFVDRRGGAQ